MVFKPYLVLKERSLVKMKLPAAPLKSGRVIKAEAAVALTSYGTPCCAEANPISLFELRHGSPRHRCRSVAEGEDRSQSPQPRWAGFLSDPQALRAGGRFATRVLPFRVNQDLNAIVVLTPSRLMISRATTLPLSSRVSLAVFNFVWMVASVS